MINAELGVLVLRIVSPGAQHENPKHLGDRFQSFFLHEREYL